MSLPVPNLDDRSWKQIVDEAVRLIPRYCPEWTNHNASDPGVTLLELYAWMTALTQLRLVLGTRLGITEDANPPDDDPAYGVYSYLSYLQEVIVEALSSTGS